MSIRKALALCALAAILNAAMAATSNDSKAVIEQDRRLNQLISAGDVQAAAPLYLEEFVLTTSRGQTKTKEDLVRELSSADLHFDLNETSNVVVRQHGDVAVLTATLRQRGVFREKAFDATLLVTDTWLRTKDGWRLLAGHASTAP